MPRGSYRTIGMMAAGLFFLVLASGMPAAQETEEQEWPKQIDLDQATILIYQPQIEGFEGDILSSRAAVSVTAASQEEPAFGVIWMDARVTTDRNTRMVEILDVKVTRVRFPEASDDRQKQLAQIVENERAGAALAEDEAQGRPLIRGGRTLSPGVANTQVES